MHPEHELPAHERRSLGGLWRRAQSVFRGAYYDYADLSYFTMLRNSNAEGQDPNVNEDEPDWATKFCDEHLRNISMHAANTQDGGGGLL